MRWVYFLVTPLGGLIGRPKIADIILAEYDLITATRPCITMHAVPQILTVTDCPSICGFRPSRWLSLGGTSHHSPHAYGELIGFRIELYHWASREKKGFLSNVYLILIGVNVVLCASIA